MDVDAIKATLSAPWRIFCCWMEYWDVPLIHINTDVANIRLQEKNKGLVLHNIDMDVTYTISTPQLDWKRGRRNGGWNVLADPPDYDGTDDDFLEPYAINEDCLV